MVRVKKRIWCGAVCEQEIYHVFSAKNLKAKPRVRFKNEKEREWHRMNMSKKKHARNFNTNFNSESLYSTLTFDDGHEVHTFEEAKHIRDLFLRRLKYAYPDAVIFSYIGRGKSTNRIHMHMVSNSIPEGVIKKKWKYGAVIRIEKLREHNYYDGVDYGQDYTGLANYLFGHWTPEQGGHRWSQTKNAKQPEEEIPTEIKRTYSQDKPPLSPRGYELVESQSTDYGYMCFKYVKTHRKKRPKNQKYIS